MDQGQARCEEVAGGWRGCSVEGGEGQGRSSRTAFWSIARILS